MTDTTPSFSPGDLANLLTPAETVRIPAEKSGKVRICPLDNRVIDITDPDDLIDSLELANEANAVLQSWRASLKEYLAALRSGKQKTQRVRGKRRQVKVVAPPDKIEQSILKEAWNSYPDLRDDYLRISSLSIKAREFKKAATTNGPPDFNNFVQMVSSAICEPTSLPTITIEE